ncbi:MAG: 1,4-alpha-glucan branching protein GlgB, partial [Actinobacteria bacterium]|nr:1,4-alpha-glucan branching protein GlgB [Actinomycetota bacterium]
MNISEKNKEFGQFSEYDIYLFKNGSHFKLYNKLGAHFKKINDIKGVYFAVWAPNANNVSVTGDFNNWDESMNPLVNRKDESGIWETFVPDIENGSLYKFKIKPRFKLNYFDKSDPFAFYCEIPPKTASILWDLDYEWKDIKWMDKRHEANSLSSPFSIYELHMGSWKRNSGDNFLNYREFAFEIARYVKKTGFTHVELLPVMEHPFYGSWGYQTTGYFAPTSRYGNPQDFMFFIDFLHQNDIGVILDWVPSHFPNDAHGLSLFDGTHLYEHADKRLGYHPDWKSLIFNYGRYEVKEFLINSALFWLDKYHVDGIRIDAVASMLYLDYSRKEGQWIPNIYGGRENLEAIDFLKKLNEVIYREFPDVQTFAEESTAWPMVTKPTYTGGLGFGMKWNMGWMHDTLNYFSKDPLYRKYHQNDLTFTMWYAFDENFLLPLSHDEVVYGKKSLLEKMPGDRWQKFANLRLLFSYMFAHPGKKLLFMGDEFAQINEWNHNLSIDWHLMDENMHKSVYLLVKDLNYLYTHNHSLFATDFKPEGFAWIDYNDNKNSVLSFLRIADDFNCDNKTSKGSITYFLACFNFTPVPRYNYRIGVPVSGEWKEIFNSDSEIYGGSGHGNYGKICSEKIKSHGKDFSISITLPPL